MNGAQRLLTTLTESGVDVCFANPGTSEMHFVAAMDDVPSMRGVLALFEGVATGAADGYGRVTGRPAAVLLHLGPGLGNGIANLHNARRAGSPVLTIVGEHATTHQQFDAPLQSDIAALAGNVSQFVRTTNHVADLEQDARDGVAAAIGPPSGVATLILPADVSWSEAGEGSAPSNSRTATSIDPADLKAVADALRRANHAVILVGGPATREDAVRHAVRCADAVGAQLLSETFPPFTRRGAGAVAVERVSYLGEFAASQFAEADLIVTVGAHVPATFFAYPNMASDLVPDGAALMELGVSTTDAQTTLAALAEELGAASTPGSIIEADQPEPPTGALTGASLAQAVAATLGEGTIVVDESNTGGIYLAGATKGAPSHDWLTLTGGAIGYGMPAAIGAAIGAPDQRVLCLESDGSAMYTIQALWTMARENLNITTVILSNRSYAILTMELARVGARSDAKAAQELLDLENPTLNFVSIAEGMGIAARRVETADGLVAALQDSVAKPGPMLIEAMLPKGLS